DILNGDAEADCPILGTNRVYPDNLSIGSFDQRAATVSMSDLGGYLVGIFIIKSIYKKITFRTGNDAECYCILKTMWTAQGYDLIAYFCIIIFFYRQIRFSG